MALSDKQLEKRIRNTQRRMERLQARAPDHLDRRLARLKTRLDKQQALLALPESERPTPLKVTPDMLKGALRGIAALVPPPTGPALKLVAAILDRTGAARQATKDGDATSVVDLLQDSLGDALRRAGLGGAQGKLVADLLEQLEDALEDDPA